MSQIENLNLEEKEAIEELRSRVKNVLNQDMYVDNLLFYRFLKARDFEIDKAEAMLKKHISWRKICRTDTVLENFKPSEVFLKYIQGTYLGEDKEGCVIRYTPCGNTDVKEIIKCFKLNDYLRHWLWRMESDLAHMKETNKKTGKNASKMVYILNLDKLQLSNVLHPSCTTHFLRFTEGYQDNYPERMKSFYLINAPEYYVLVYSIIRRIMAPEVVRKIHVFGRNGWKEELLKEIDADVLPAFLGGNKTDPDGNPMCDSFVHHGGKIPPKYFLTKEDRTFKDISKVKQISIPPRHRRQIEVEVKEKGSVIEWEILVESKDIAFGLSFKESEQELKEMLPIWRFETPDGTERNFFICQEIGTYIIIFDNTYSWMNRKEISYCITVNNPGT